MKYNDKHDPAFPLADSPSETGLTKRQYAAIHAPAPTMQEIQAQMDLDKLQNPHNDSYKPKRRSRLEIEWDLRYAWADGAFGKDSQ